MNIISRLLAAACASLLLLTVSLPPAKAAPGSGDVCVAPLQYKVISGLKQPFNDALQYHLSKGWTPVGGISVTTWNSDLYFAQLVSKPAKK